MTTTKDMDKTAKMFVDKMFSDATLEDLQRLGKMFGDASKKTMEQAGYKSCQEGNPHSEGNGPDYDRGYNTRYQEEQIAGAKS